MMRLKYKAADTEHYATTLATADPDLQFDMEANSTYIVRGQLQIRGSTPGDAKHGFSSGSATIIYAAGMSSTWRNAEADSVKAAETLHAPWTAAMLTAGSTRVQSMTTGSYRRPLSFVWLIKTGASGGTFSVVWAQQVADAINPAKVLAGAILQYEKLP